MSTTADFYPDGFRVWWNPNQADEVHLVTHDPVFNSDDKDRPGLWVTFSSKPHSANYHPQNFNRVARALSDLGKPGPAEVSEHDRRLKGRGRLIDWWKKNNDDDQP